MLKIHLVQLFYNPAYYEPPVDYLQEPIFYDENDTPVGSLRSIANVKDFLSDLGSSYLEHLKHKLSYIVEWSGKRGGKIIVFPEYSIPYKLLPELKALSKKHSIIIIAGTHRVRSDDEATEIYRLLRIPQQNIPVGCAFAPIIFPDGAVNQAVKTKKFKWEQNLLTPDIDPLVINISINKKPVRIAVVPCIDSLNLDVVGKLWEKKNSKPNFIICPSLSPATSPFQEFGSLLKLREVLFAYVNSAYFGGTFFNIPSDWDQFLKGSKYGLQILPKNIEAILEVNVNPQAFFLKKGSLESSTVCTYPIAFPIVYEKSANWLSELSTLREILLEEIGKSEQKSAIDLLDEYLSKKSNELPTLVFKNINDVGHSLIPLFGGDPEGIENATNLIIVSNEIEDAQIFYARRVNKAIKKLTDLFLIEYSPELSELLLKCLNTPKKTSTNTPVS